MVDDSFRRTYGIRSRDLIKITDKTSRHKDIDFPGHKHASLYDVNLIEEKSITI